jgi:hypothetical protein
MTHHDYQILSRLGAYPVAYASLADDIASERGLTRVVVRRELAGELQTLCGRGWPIVMSHEQHDGHDHEDAPIESVCLARSEAARVRRLCERHARIYLPQEAA